MSSMEVPASSDEIVSLIWFITLLCTALNIFHLIEVQGISEALGKAGAVYKYDFSLSPEHFYKIVEDLRDRLGESASLCVVCPGIRQWSNYSNGN